MHIFVRLALFLLVSLIASCTSKNIELESPSKELKVHVIEDESGLKLKLSRSGYPLAIVDLGGFVFTGDTLHEFQIGKLAHSSKAEEWNPVYGERKTISNNYNELELTLLDKENSSNTLRLVCRLYDEGLAFRYVFDNTHSDNIHINSELTTFNFDNDYYTWITDRAQSEYRKTKISEIDNPAERPLVIEMNDSAYLALGEAALVDYARGKFIRNSEHPNSLKVDLASEVDLTIAGYQTPWRYIMVAASPSRLLENNYFIENLNEPNQIADISWIKPGKIIREVTLTTQGGIACVDFAAAHNLQYIEFDAGWYGNEYDDSSDATTITVDPNRSPGPLELHKVIDYANSKDIGIILYVNRRALEKQIDEVLPLLQSWGVKGVKYGFVNVGPQQWTRWLHDAVRKAAEHELMVDIHDEYRPSGYSRTYPNLMTQEGIRGDEESPTIEHTLITLFTRMIAGAGDNTNCYLAPRVQEKMGGKTAQMAKAIMIYSPWQFIYWYDRPEGSPNKTGGAGAAQGILNDNEDLSFYDALPCTWDETIVLEGKIGEIATIARKNGADWYIGSLTAKESRTLEISLSFLQENVNYSAVIYYQNENDLKENKISKESIEVNSSSIINRDLIGNSGLAMIISKI